MTKTIHLLIAIYLVSIVAGCQVCTLQARPGITVVLYDQVTGLAICDAKVTATDGDFIEVLRSYYRGPSTCEFPYNKASGLLERPGLYNVTVELPGYVTWTQNNVEVTRGQCGVNTISLQAYINPL